MIPAEWKYKTGLGLWSDKLRAGLAFTDDGFAAAIRADRKWKAPREVARAQKRLLR
jgi:hypothetical protein